MSNPNLTSEELARAKELLAEIRQKLDALSGGDKNLLFAYRRNIFKHLMYDERSTPMVRRKLKLEKRDEQRGLCAICSKELPAKYTVLDRLNAADGYTKENTRLIHQECDVAFQVSKGYT